MIKIVIVDDHSWMREALAEVFAQTPDICVVGECKDGTEVVDTALRTEPDVVLMDESMPRMTGLEATRQLLAVRPHSRVVMLTGTVTVASVCEALALGAAGYLTKGEDPGGLPTCVRCVAAGYAVWSPEAAAHLASCSN